MYAVVQIGSTILRSECMTTLSTVSARAVVTVTTRHQSMEAAAHAAAHRRTNVMGFPPRDFSGYLARAGEWAAPSILLPDTQEEITRRSSLSTWPMVSSCSVPPHLLRSDPVP